MDCPECGGAGQRCVKLLGATDPVDGPVDCGRCGGTGQLSTRVLADPFSVQPMPGQPAYTLEEAARVSALVESAAEASDRYGDDELEYWASQMRPRPRRRGS
jgi:hypothetical protein